MVFKAGRRFGDHSTRVHVSTDPSITTPPFAHQDFDQDLERNSQPQPQPQPMASGLARLLSRIVLAKQIKGIPRLVAMAAFFVAIPIDLISATRTPKWGCALVYLSWFLFVLQSYLLLISIHEDYICTIVPVLLFAALLPWKQPNSTEGEPAQRIVEDQDKADQDLENIFDWSAGIVNCGGLISMILGHYMYIGRGQPTYVGKRHQRSKVPQTLAASPFLPTT
ncbi:hypothetical protein HU200_005023 [Digitaria exilis]|uniref:Uncharacterized protein n=1 Tax=Digitaria exilis TaxID=1010633 RepID=A0A835FTP3_9POAL|nr:hypothetical protein HU200_005023 [Digitaria exilis]